MTPARLYYRHREKEMKMIRETRKERIEREHREVVARVMKRYIEGAAALPHNQKSETR